MRGLSALELLAVWERGQACPATARALLPLAVASNASPDELANLSLGERDARLLSLRELTFGSKLAGLATCHACGGTIEFSFHAADVRAPVDAAASLDPLVTSDYELRFRLPDTADLAAIGDASDPASGRRLLIERCISAIDRAGVAVPVDTIPDAVVTSVVERMAQADPQAEVQIALACPACGHRWEPAFDVATFFWNELQAYAWRLLRDVHRLARAYGWHEADILAMSPFRRDAYLELLGE